MAQRTSLLALASTSFCLSAAIIGCASHTLQDYKSQATTNAWWLPIWPQHFDTRGLETLVGTSVVVLVLTAVVFVGGLLPAVSILQSWRASTF